MNQFFKTEVKQNESPLTGLVNGLSFYTMIQILIKTWSWNDL